MNDQAEKTKQSGRIYIVLREFISIIIWLSIIVKLLIFDYDTYLAEKYIPAFCWIFNYKFIGLLILISVILLFCGKKTIPKLLLYTASYPLILIFWKIPKLLFRNWAYVIVFAPSIYEVIVSFRYRFIHATLAIISALIIILSYKSYLLVPSIIILGTYLFAYLYRSLKRAYRSSIYESLASLVQKLRKDFEKGEKAPWEKVEIESESEEKQEEYEKQLSIFYMSNCFVELIADKLKTVAKSRKCDLYLIMSWFGTVFITAFVFALVYWAVYKINPNSFIAEYSLSFLNFWGYSFGRLTASSISSIKSVSVIASIIAYLEILCTLIIFVILVFSFLTASREKYKDDIDIIILEVNKLDHAMQDHFVRLFEIALADVEYILLRKNAKMVNWLRQKRGLTELPVSEEDENDQEGNQDNHG